MSKRESYSPIGKGIDQMVQVDSKNNIWLTEYQLRKAAHDCGMLHMTI